MATTLKPTPVPTPTLSGGFSFASPTFYQNARPAAVQGPGLGIYGPQDSPNKSAVLGASSTYTPRTSSPTPAPTPTQQVNPFQSAQNAQQSANDALLSSLNTQYDQYSALANDQLKSLDTQKANTLSSYDTAFKGVQDKVGQSKAEGDTALQNNINDALSAAQATVSKNRNTLRALGILNSSAAGDILSRPMEAYDKQRSSMVQEHTQRNNQLDDFLNQKTAEHADSIKQVESQYVDLVGKIQNDLRFSQRQKADAIQAANAALQQHIADIQQQQVSYENQVQAMKTQLATQLAQIMQYQQPKADINSILSSAYSAANNLYSPQSVGIAQDPQKRLSAV